MSKADDFTHKEYPKGDFRRTLSVLHAIASDTASDDVKAQSTLVKLVKRTGIDKKTVTMMISQAIEQIGVEIRKNGAVYTMVNWGPVLKAEGARKAARGQLEPAEASAHLIIPRPVRAPKEDASE
jgi:hypothetical protein